MNKITFLLKQGMKSPEVGNLQDALQLLLNRGVLLAKDEAARRELSEALRRERNEQTYGETTSKLVSVFQEERRLQAGGRWMNPPPLCSTRCYAKWGYWKSSLQKHRCLS